MKKIVFKKGIQNIHFPILRPMYTTDPLSKEFLENLDKIKSHYSFGKKVKFKYSIVLEEGGTYSAQLTAYK